MSKLTTPMIFIAVAYFGWIAGVKSEQWRVHAQNTGTITIKPPDSSSATYILKPDGTPIPNWVPDPSAGHFDCPDGWIAYERTEPRTYSEQLQSVPAIYQAPILDTKGHVLGAKRTPQYAACIQEKP
jgi:hypothetical protein